MSYSALYSCCTGAKSMTFTTCGVIVGSRILVVMQRACHAVGSCVNCEIPHVVNIIDLALTRSTTVQGTIHYSRTLLQKRASLC